LEYLEGGNLNSLVTKKEPGWVENLKDIILQIAKGLKYLHDFGIIHRDLKLENVMLTTSNSIYYHLDYDDISKDYAPIQSVKIMDFGLSKVVGIYDSTIEGYGSLCYTTPEIILKRNYNHKVDVWSFGVLLYFCLTRLFPFDDAEDNINNIARKIVYSNDIAKPKFLIEPQFDQKSFKLVLECLQKNPNKRLSAENIVGNDWFIN
jgi:serine/threonine protein kinase